MVDGGGVDCPVVFRKLSELHGVVAHRRQAVAARLPRQQDVAGLNVFLRDHGAAGGLGTSWMGRERRKETPGGIIIRRKGWSGIKGWRGCMGNGCWEEEYGEGWRNEKKLELF